MPGLTAAAMFVVSLLFSFFIFTLWIRITLRYFHISALDPVSKLIHTFTDPLVKPLEKIKLKKSKVFKRFDVSDFIVLIIVETLKLICLSLLAFHQLMSFPLLVLYVLADLAMQPCDLLFLAIIVRIIMSFTNPGWSGPFADFLKILTDPLLRIGRRIIPDISGFDFSPYIMLMILKTVTLFINANLPWRIL